MADIDAVFESEALLDNDLIRHHSAEHAWTGERAAQLAGGVGRRQPHGEQTPLLSGCVQGDQRVSTDSTEDNQTRRDSSDWQWKSEFDHLPWWKRPSIYFLLGPFFIFTCAFGGIIVLKLNLMLNLVCRDYYSEMASRDPSYKFSPVLSQSGTSEECRVPEVQTRVVLFNLAGSLISGILAALVSPKLGQISDRYGRRPIMLFTTLGMLTSEIINIVAATNPATFPTAWLLVGFFFDGLCGSFITNLAIAHSYATDCTPPERLNVAFGYFHACLFGGIAIGPIVAAGVIKLSGTSVTMFYVCLACHATFAACIIFIIPEALSKPRQMKARAKYEQTMQANVSNKFLVRLRRFNFFEPLKVLWPTDEGSSPALRRNLIILVSIDTIIFGVAMGSMQVVIYYIGARFGWGSFEQNILMSVTNTCRFLALFVVLPLLVRIFRGRVPSKRRLDEPQGCDKLDLGIIRGAVFFEVIGYVGYILAARGEVFVMFGCVAALGGIGSPTIQSAMTKHVPYDRTGQLLGATGLMHAMARVVGPIVTNAVYAATTKSFQPAVFVLLASLFGIAFVLSWFLKSHVYIEDENMPAASLHDGEQDEQVGRL